MDGLRELLDQALRAQKQAYAPYSEFRVGAALRAESGAVHRGCNVENASYPAGLCAETAAVSAMILAGDRRITDILIVGGVQAAITPCGVCRQLLNEFSTSETRVHSATPDGIVATYSLRDLLPHAFGPDDLARPSASREEKP
jgi:cytidine deaminase